MNTMPRIITTMFAVLATALALSAAPKTMKFLSVWPENQDNARLILDLTKEYQKTHPDFVFQIEVVEPSRLQQKIRVLQAAHDLPDVFAYSAGVPLLELVDAGVILNMEQTFRNLGIAESLDPGAVSLLKRLALGRGLFALPLGMNVEGIWYNKKIFADLGLKVPSSWEDLEKNSELLIKKGIQPFATGGKDRWPLSRLLNMYILRKSGTTALEQATTGKRSLTDPEFVEAAARFQGYAKAGWFGTGYLAMSNAAAETQFLTGKSAMIYDGSWFTQSLNDTTANTLGPEGVGFFNIPLVKGGLGSLGDYSVNCGNVLCFSSAKFDAATADWMTFIFTRLGEYAMDKYGAPKGYRVTRMPGKISAYTRLVLDELGKVKNPGLWFEASFDAKTAQVALDGVQALFVGALSPSDFFQKIAASSKANQQTR